MKQFNLFGIEDNEDKTIEKYQKIIELWKTQTKQKNNHYAK